MGRRRWRVPSYVYRKVWAKSRNLKARLPTPKLRCGTGPSKLVVGTHPQPQQDSFFQFRLRSQVQVSGRIAKRDLRTARKTVNLGTLHSKKRIATRRQGIRATFQQQREVNKTFINPKRRSNAEPTSLSVLPPSLSPQDFSRLGALQLLLLLPLLLSAIIKYLHPISITRASQN